MCGFLLQASAKQPVQWELVAPGPPAVTLESISCGSEGFVLADTGGFVVTSADGRTWTRYASPFAPRKVIHEGGRFVGVDGSAIYTSPDGTTWERRETPSMRSVLDIAYGNGLYVAAGSNTNLYDRGTATIFVSEDSEAWEERVVYTDDPSYDSSDSDVIFGGGKFVAVLSYEGPPGNRLLTSTNGRNWNITYSPSGFFLPYTVGYGNGLFVALGYSINGYMLTSPDAENWRIQGGIFSEDQAMQAVAYGNGVFVAGGREPHEANWIFYSMNGSDWLPTCPTCSGAFPVNTKPIKSIAFCSGRFIAVAEQNTLYTSTDGREWTVLMDDANLHAVTYGNGKFVAVGSNSTVWVSSDSGRNWDWAFGGRDTGIPALYGVAFGNNTFVAVGGQGPYVAASSDGFQWTPWASPHSPSNATFHAITFGKGLFVAVGELVASVGRAEPQLATSANGIDWVYQTVPQPATWGSLRGVAYGNGIFVAVGDGMILTSTNGTNWVLGNPGGAPLHAVTYYDGRFIAGSDKGRIFTSTDGTTWTPASSTSFHNLGLGAGDGVVAVGYAGAEGRLHCSSDGLTWPGNSMAFSRALNDVSYGNGTWVAVGNGGLIVRTASPEIRLYDSRYTAIGFETKVEWPIGLTYRIQGSPDMADWVTLLTITPTTSPFLFQDPASLNYSNRFYRFVSP